MARVVLMAEPKGERHMKKLLGCWLLLLAPVYAGQSLSLAGSQVVENTTVAARGANAACRVEFQIHDWGTGSGAVNDLNACGMEITANGGQMLVIPQRTTGWGCCRDVQIPLSAFGGERWAVVRGQLVPNGVGGRFLLEAWDIRGVRVFSSAVGYTGTVGINARGASVNPGLGGVKHGFFRVFTTTVAPNSRPPVFADVGDWLEWKFDGTLADGSGRGYNGTLSSGTATYVATPGQTLVKARPQTDAPPSWGDWKAARAGFPLKLDGGRSFSWTDGGGTISCFWQAVSRPKNAPLPTFDNRNSCTPTVNGLVFGPYTFRLTITTAGGKNTADLPMGAVVYDRNGVVVPPSSVATQIFGPMIAYGQNPWAFADERAITGMQLRKAEYMKPQPYGGYSIGRPAWDETQPGTVSFIWNGKGFALGQACTTLTAAASNTATSLAVANAACLDLSELPTRITLQASPTNGAFEEVRICGASATTGPATLTVCYDGRGITPVSDAGSVTGAVLGAQNWNSGATVGQSLVKGNGTSFGTMLCPGGMPGPVGPVTYDVGTVGLTAGSTTLTGVGTNWTTTNVEVGSALRVQALQSGVPFVFVAYVTSVNSGTEITLNRPFPASATTAAGLAYKFVKPWYRRIVTHFLRPPDSSDAIIGWGSTSCESNTQTFFNIGVHGHDTPLNRTAFTGQQYSFWDQDGYINSAGPGSTSFYGECLANLALYYRSGYGEALEAAKMVCDHWIRHPSLRGGVGGLSFSPLSLGGGVIETIAALLLDPDTPHSWSDVRGFVALGEGIAPVQTCIDWDTRDGGYQAAWLALGARYDPDPAFRQRWRTALQQFYQRDLICKRSDNSWSNRFFFNAGGPLFNLTAGSATVTGTAIDPAMCEGIAQGRASVTALSAPIEAVTGTFASNATAIILTGTKSGEPFTGFYELGRANATQGQLSALWPGDTGEVTFMTTATVIPAPNTHITFGENNADADLDHQYACIWNSATQITLDRPWVGNTAAHFAFRDNESGYGQQPFMVGIQAYAMDQAASLDTALSQNYTGLRNLAATWLREVGYDPNTRGLRSGIFGFSRTQPQVASGNFTWTIPGLTYGHIPGAVRASRTLAGEVSAALRYFLEATNGSVDARSWGDSVYSGIWGSCAFTAAEFGCDANYVVDETSNLSLSSGKWLGFFFGMGMAHQWPAARLGAPAPARIRTVHIGKVNLAAASIVRATVLSPNGKLTTFACATEDCPIQVDDRQGLHWYKVQYLSASQKLLRETPMVLLTHTIAE
jgi:hypothetical protein